jgi:PAS domain S-box-containing protein
MENKDRFERQIKTKPRLTIKPGLSVREPAGNKFDSNSQLDLQNILDAFPFYVLLVDSDHNIVMANKAVSSRLGVDRKDIIGLNCPMVIHGTEGAFSGCPLEEAAKKNSAIEREIFDEKSGHWIVSSIYPTGTITPTGKKIFLHMVTDVTIKKQAQQQLETSHRQLRSLASYMESIREEEKQKIARDLHDDTSQILASLYAHLEAAIGSLPEEANQAKTNIRKAQELSTNVLDGIHKLIFELRPTVLDRLGLMAAIRSLVDNQVNDDRLKIKFKIIGHERRLNSKIEIAIYRVVQEAFNNIIRHSKANKADLLVHFRKNNLTIKIKDNGTGFDIQEAINSKERPRGWGLLGMKERVELLGGAVIFNSVINRGTDITLEIPLEQGADDGQD